MKIHLRLILDKLGMSAKDQACGARIGEKLPTTEIFARKEAVVTKRLILSILATVTAAISGWAQEGQPVPLPNVCRGITQRNPSLTESACEERLRPGAPTLPECAKEFTENLYNYRYCASRQPSDEVLADQRLKKQAEAEAIHKRLFEKLKAADIDLPAGMSRLPTPNEALVKYKQDLAASGDTYNRFAAEARMDAAKAVELRAIEAGLSEIVDPVEAGQIRREQSGWVTFGECRVHLELGMSSDQVIKYCGKPLQDFYQSHGGGEVLVYSGGAVVIVPPLGLSRVIGDNSWQQLK